MCIVQFCFKRSNGLKFNLLAIKVLARRSCSGMVVMKEGMGFTGEGIDRIVTLDVSARGVINNLYSAARRLCVYPLCMSAAQRIVEAMKKADIAIVTTGFAVLPQKVQETDGPIGAAALARALNVAFNVNTILITENQTKEILTSTLHALQMDVKTREREFSFRKKNSVLVLGFPLAHKEAIKEAKRIMDTHTPMLVLAIEKAGRNSKGEYHTMSGENISSFHSKIERLVEEAKKRNILTVAIGDGGNEVGMGNIRETVLNFVPNAMVCHCPCKAGIAADSKVDLLVAASISNWGAYGIEACIASLTGKPEVLHTPRQEALMLKSAVKTGAVDGVTGRQECSVDGVALRVHVSMMKILEGLICK